MGNGGGFRGRHARGNLRGVVVIRAFERADGREHGSGIGGTREIDRRERLARLAGCGERGIVSRRCGRLMRGGRLGGGIGARPGRRRSRRRGARLERRLPHAIARARDALQRFVQRVRFARRAQPVDDARRLDLLAGRAEAQHRAAHQLADADAEVVRRRGDGAFLGGRHEDDDAFAGLVHRSARVLCWCRTAEESGQGARPAWRASNHHKTKPWRAVACRCKSGGLQNGCHINGLPELQGYCPQGFAQFLLITAQARNGGARAAFLHFRARS
ncbi:hypothetical protein BN2476_320074 [Paraburkholderia piptadeniae]|uniref:Uncharacterized protein n=1 Tax=Paraburkholderia piptadeniae TaxID=1701573 RepID=A0A1N7S4U0_9BURK|nr:hypothetical protein BN2476_320074 [Paraburkholderia piptadeniae]